MEWMPDLKIELLNGWIPLASLALTEGILFLVFPSEVVARLFDRSGWSQRQVIFTLMGKLCALGCLALLTLTPLKIGAPIFALGIAVVALGLVGLAKALFDFKNAPPDEPVTQGIYSISRHPQIVMSSVVILGACVAAGSWAAMLMLLAARLFGHFGILAEEEVCLQEYGEAYRAYIEQVPRYLLLF